MSEDRLKKFVDLAKRKTADEFRLLCPGCFLLVSIPGLDDDDLEFHTEIVSTGPGPGSPRDTAVFGKPFSTKDEVEPGNYLYEVKKHANNGWIDWIAVGRAKNNDVIIRHQSVSKLHARIHNENNGDSTSKPVGQMWVTDMNSSSGTWINSTMLKPNEPAQLSVGDKVRLGQVNCTFILGEALRSAILRMP